MFLIIMPGLFQFCNSGSRLFCLGHGHMKKRRRGTCRAVLRLLWPDSVDFKLRFPGLEEAVDLIGSGGAGVIIRLGRLRAAFLRRRENPRAEFFFQLRVALRRDVGKIN